MGSIEELDRLQAEAAADGGTLAFLMRDDGSADGAFLKIMSSGGLVKVVINETSYMLPEHDFRQLLKQAGLA